MKKLLSLIASIVLVTSFSALAKEKPAADASTKPAKAKPLTEKGKIEKLDAAGGHLSVGGKDFKLDEKAKVMLGGDKKAAADMKGAKTEAKADAKAASKMDVKK